MQRALVVGLVLVLTACGKSSTSTPSSTTPPADPGGAPPPVDTTDAGEGSGDADPSDAAATDPHPGDDPADPGDEPVAAIDPEGPVPVAADPSEGLTEPTNMASVKLEIKGEDGKVFKDNARVIRWDQLTRIPINFGSRLHEFDVQLSQDGKSKLGIQMSYNVGGKEVLRKYQFDSKVGTREVIQIEGGVAVAITVTPKTIKPKTAAEREKVETSTSRDPLAGAKN